MVGHSKFAIASAQREKETVSSVRPAATKIQIHAVTNEIDKMIDGLID
jgi:hypothetical protein